MKEIHGWLGADAAQILHEYAEKSPTKVILEIGSFMGKSAHVLASAIKEKGGTLVCMDYFKNNNLFTKDGSKTVLSMFATFWENMSDLDNIITIQGDYKQNLPKLKGKFGLVYIDGGHDFENTLIPAEYAWENVVDGGYIIFHDYSNPTYPDVQKCVDMLKIKWSREFIRTTLRREMVVIQK